MPGARPFCPSWSGDRIDCRRNLGGLTLARWRSRARGRLPAVPAPTGQRRSRAAMACAATLPLARGPAAHPGPPIARGGRIRHRGRAPQVARASRSRRRTPQRGPAGLVRASPLQFTRGPRANGTIGHSILLLKEKQNRASSTLLKSSLLLFREEIRLAFCLTSPPAGEYGSNGKRICACRRAQRAAARWHRWVAPRRP